MSVSVQFFGVAGYKIITAQGQHVVIDPFMDGNPGCPIKYADLERVDLLLLTHNAFDHFGQAPEIVQRYNPVVICAVDVMHHLVHYYGASADLFRPTIWGMAVEHNGVFVRPCESRHWSFTRKPDGALLSGPAMGFVIDAGEGHIIYHPGDTALFSDMSLIGRFLKPTIGLMHVTLPEGPGVSLAHQEEYRGGEMTPEEALLASEWLNLNEIVVSHYMDPQCPDVKEFCQLVENNRARNAYAPITTVLAPGQSKIW